MIKDGIKKLIIFFLKLNVEGSSLIMNKKLIENTITP